MHYFYTFDRDPRVEIYRLYITRNNKSTIILHVESTSTIKQVKNEIYHKANKATNYQLVFKGTMLTDENRTIQSYNIKNQSFISLQCLQPAVQKLYNELEGILKQNHYDLDTLQNDIQYDRGVINALCTSMNLDIAQKMKFRKLMRLINNDKDKHAPPKDVECKYENYFDVTNKTAHTMTILVAGDKRVGKTSLIERYTQNRAQLSPSNDNQEYVVSHHQIIDNGTDCSVSIDMKIVETNFIQQKADTIVLCYDKNKPKSYDYCLKLREEIINVKDVVIMLVGCKSDEGYVDPKYEENKTLNIMNDPGWEQFNFWALECSAMNGANVRNIFITAAQLFLNKIEMNNKHSIMLEKDEQISRELISLALGEDDGIKWTKIHSKQKGIEVEWAHTGQKGKKNTGVVTVRSSVKTTVSADQFYEFVDAQKDGIFNAKRDYDKLCLSCKAVKRYGNNRCLVYSEYKAPNFADKVVLNRDFCYFQFRKKYKTYKHKNKSKYIVAVIGYNADRTVDGYVPEREQRVRADLCMTGFVLEKIKKTLWKNKINKSKAYYIVKMDPCGYIPHVLVNMTATAKGYDIKWIRDKLPDLINMMVVTTNLSTNKKTELIVYGYIHQFDKQNLMISSVVELIKLFYTGIATFSWNKDCRGKYMRWIDNKTIGTKFVYLPSGCVSNQIISSELCAWYEWEFKLNRWALGACIHFGYIAHPKRLSNWDKFLNHGPTFWPQIVRYFFVSISGNRRDSNFTLCESGKNSTKKIVSSIKTKRKYTLNVKAGDRFKMRVDFKSQKIELFYNDEYVNSVYDATIPNSVIPAISLSLAEISVIHTDYN